MEWKSAVTILLYCINYLISMREYYKQQKKIKQHYIGRHFTASLTKPYLLIVILFSFAPCLPLINTVHKLVYCQLVFTKISDKLFGHLHNILYSTHSIVTIYMSKPETMQNEVSTV